MAEFKDALRKTLIHEGVQFDIEGEPIPGKTGHVHDPADPGGETNYGITRNVALANGYTGDMVSIPYSFVGMVYRTAYWDRIRGDEIPNQEIAEELFDTAVNMGVKPAVTFLQRTLNVLNAGGTKYPDLKADGNMGPVTVAALGAALGLSPWYGMIILRALDALQAVRYIELAEANPRLERFAPGWLRTRVGG